MIDVRAAGPYPHTSASLGPLACIPFLTCVIVVSTETSRQKQQR